MEPLLEGFEPEGDEEGLDVGMDDAPDVDDASDGDDAE